MKKFIFFLLALFFVTTLSATTPPVGPDEPMKVRSKTHAEGLELRLANLEQVRTMVRFTNLDENQVVFTRFVRKHNGYVCLIKQDNLPQGRYLLEVNKGKAKRSQVILVTGNGMLASDWK